MKWLVNISSEDNGFVVKFISGDEKYTMVYQEKDNTEPSDIEHDKEHVHNMLWDILEYFGMSGSKHDKKRLYIKYE